MTHCTHLRGVEHHTKRDGNEITVHRCDLHGRCTMKSEHQKLIGVAGIHACDVCPDLQTPTYVPAAMPSIPRPPRHKGNFAYFTGTNRREDRWLIASLLKSMRNANIHEDLHVFGPDAVTGAINHYSGIDVPWNLHMAKLEFARQMVGLGYEYIVWLDTDNYFVRDPGDLKNLLRDNPLWVCMEADMTQQPKTKERGWYFKDHEEVCRLFREEGVTTKSVWSSNGGMWIVRTDDIDRLYAEAFRIFHKWQSGGFKEANDEVVLACIGAKWMKDPENSTMSSTQDTWACDWNKKFVTSPPVGQPWVYTDWMYGTEWTINPAIVHCMRGKEILKKLGQATGTRLHEVLTECGITPPNNCSCSRWIADMNTWGIEGCRQRRGEIREHLKTASNQSSWLDLLRVAARGYLSIDSLVDEALRRAESV